MSIVATAEPAEAARPRALPAGGLRFCLRHPATLPRWFLSRRYRRAVELRKHVWKLRQHQRDILKPAALTAVDGAITAFDALLRAAPDRAALEQGTKAFEEAANKWLIPYPNASIRENVEVFLVAIGVAMGIRTFFLQPFKIPTGSMQPTLYGTHFTDLRDAPPGAVPGPLGRFAAAIFKGDIYHELIAEEDGEVADVRPVSPFLKFISRQDVVLRYAGGRQVTETIWFSPVDGNGGDLRKGLGAVVGRDEPTPFLPLLPGQPFKKGDVLLRMKDSAGDHLFVDRVTYNFRKPERGEIIVFETRGIRALPQDQFYIKRMVGLGGETLRLGDDRHLVVDGRRLDATTPHFERVYAFAGPPRDSHFSGHVNGEVGRAAKPFVNWSGIAFHFPDARTDYQVPPEHYVVMGDNTMNSYDSRGWGSVHGHRVIGKYCFVWWPFTERWGTRPK
jgi:signal peptidase I